MEDHSRALVVMEEREDEREDDHAEDLEHDAGVVDDRDGRTPKMFRTVIATSVMAATHRWFEWLLARFQPMLLNAGISASGSVAHTDATVRMPAKR